MGAIIGILFVGVLIVRHFTTITVINRRVIGVPFAKMIYTDATGGKLLVCRTLNIQGKPDYIFENYITSKLIPLELKSSTLKADLPYDGDLYQLIVYFLIIEAVYKKKPPYGMLVYSNKSFRVRNTAALRKQAKSQIKDMRLMLDGASVISDCYQSYAKCRYCTARKTVCSMPLK